MQTSILSSKAWTQKRTVWKIKLHTEVKTFWKPKSFVIHETWLDVNFLHHIKNLTDYICELFEVELEAGRNYSTDCCRFIVELTMHENEVS